MEAITIIVACYNVEAFLEECLQSIANQTYTHFKVLAINDGATDATPKIIDQFAAKDARFQAIHQSNKGLSETRNVGIAEVRTPWVTFIDGDDYLAPNYLQQLLLNANHHDVVLCSYNRVYKTTQLPRKFGMSGSWEASQLQRRIIGLINEELSDPSQADSMVTAWGKLYRSEIITEHHLQFTSTKLIGTEDALFNIQYLEQAKSVFILDEPLYQYRKYNLHSLTNTYKAHLKMQWSTLYEKIRPYTQNKEQTFETAFYNRIALSLIGLGLNEQLNPNGFTARYAAIKALLNEPLYRKAYADLKYSFLPLHWKVFFILAKWRCVIGVLLMLAAIQNILKKNQ
ncbi:MAG: glycosyltransferase family 2 protein [Flavobacterium stagni]